jgi:phosphoribosylformylglycinamidine synthase
MEAIIEIGYKTGIFDASGESIKRGVGDLGVKGIKSVGTHQLYLVKCSLQQKDLQYIAQNVLCDPIIQNYKIINQTEQKKTVHKKHYAVEVWFKKGVTDNVGESVKKAIEDLEIVGIDEIHTGRKFILEGNIKRPEVVTITTRLLANEVVEDYKIYGES